jgi:hypothetical protein
MTAVSKYLPKGEAGPRIHCDKAANSIALVNP